MILPLKHPDCLFVGGEWVRPSERDDVINPATEEVLAAAPFGGAAESEAAIAAAREAFDRGPWPRMSAKERAGVLQLMHDAIMRRADDIERLLLAEVGAPKAALRGMQFDIALQHARFFIDQCAAFAPTSLPVEVSSAPDGRKVLGAAVVVREPMGVVAALTAFNAPLLLNITKIFPALATGNTVILKPSQFTPFTAFILGDIAEEAGLPKGALNIINGDAAMGEALTCDPRVDLVSFTGSDKVGAAIQAQVAPTLKRCLFELGGKSALIIRHDGAIKAAAAATASAFAHSAGQACAAMTRVLVHNSVRAAFVDQLASMFTSLRLGDPTEAATQMGPLIRDSQRRRVEMYIEGGVADGARLVVGGNRPAHLRRGYFFEPTVFDDVDNRSRLAQEEIFGPVVSIIGFDTDEEAIAIANDSAYGLSGGLYSADVGRAYEMALQLRTGRVNINGGFGKVSSYIPFGGIKRSGYGREYGENGLHEYTYEKAIAFHGG